MEKSTHRITCLLPARLDRWLRIRAAHQETSRSDLIRRLLTRQILGFLPADQTHHALTKPSVCRVHAFFGLLLPILIQPLPQALALFYLAPWLAGRCPPCSGPPAPAGWIPPGL